MIANRLQASVGSWLVSPYAAAVMLSVMICASTWPGAMSFDPLWELKQARIGIQDGLYPPMASYIFWVFDRIYPGPGLKFLAQNLIVFLCVAHILKRFGFGPLSSLGVQFFLAACPATLGTFVVVWKDTATASCLLLSLSMLVEASRATGGIRKYGFLGAALFFLFMTAAYRLNGIAACFPILVWMSDMLIRKRGVKLPAPSWPLYGLKFAAVYVVMLAVIIGATGLVNTYRLPDFKYLTPGGAIQGNCQFDVIGMSHFSRKILVPDELFARGKPSLAAIDEGYHPEHWFYTRESKAFKRYDHFDYCGIFRRAILEYPLAWLQHRLAVTNHLFAVTTEGAYLPTHFGIDENDLGVLFVPSTLSQITYGYIKAMASTLARPWIYYVLATVILVIGLRRRAPSMPVAFTIYSSGVLYILASLPVMPAGDLRYNMWTLIACILSSALILRDLYPPQMPETTRQTWRRRAYGGLGIAMLLALLLAQNNLLPVSLAPRPLPFSSWKQIESKLVPCLCGNLDQVSLQGDKTIVAGWAYDVGANSPVKYVHVFIGGKHKYSVPASGLRWDVVEGQRRWRAAWSGFRAALPEKTKKVRVIVQKADGSFAKLYGQP